METTSERPIDSYKRLIDDLVAYSDSIGAKLVLESGIYSKSKGAIALNDFVKSLSAQQRDTLARMLNEERRGAIHDVLATISGWIDCYGLTFQHHGQPMPVELSGMGLHGDYIGRLDGWQWPKETETA